MKNKKVLIIVGAAALLVAGVGFWFWSKNRQTPSALPPQTKETLAPTLGSEIFEKTQNPLGGLVPDANPFKDQKNPFDVIYKNPFSQ